MGRKKRKSTSRKEVDFRSLRDEQLVEKFAPLVEKGKYRRCLEIAKEIRRRGLLDEHKELVEEAYRLRAGELARKGLYTDSAVIVENAMSSGLVSGGLVELAVRCHLAAGKIAAAYRAIERARGAVSDGNEADLLLADLAVLALPSTVSGENGTKKAAAKNGAEPPFEIEPSLAGDLKRLERAFRDYESGRDDDARSELRGIPRRSPLSRWRLLLGGLIAQASGDFTTARGSWERIPRRGPCGALARSFIDRLPSSISEPSELASTSAAATGNPRAPDSREAQAANGKGSASETPVEFALPEDPRLRLLGEITQHCREDDESALIVTVKKAVSTWPGGLSAAERKRLFRAIGGAIEPNPDLYHRLRAHLGDLPANQLGLRQAALIAEGRDPEEAYGLWEEYLVEIDEVGFEPEVLPRAQALILERMGDLARRTTECTYSLPFLGIDFEDDELDAIICYEKSIELDPGAIGVRRKLAQLHKREGEIREAERVLQELLALSPSDVESLLELGEYAYGRRAYRKAFKYFDEAYRLEPLNSRVLTKLSDCMDASAWRRAGKGRYDLARKDWQRVSEIWRGSPPASSLLRWSAAEEAAHERERAEEIFENALATSIWRAEAELKLVEALARLNVKNDFYTEHRDAFTQLVREPTDDAETAERIGKIYGTLIALSDEDRHLARIRKSVHEYLRAACHVPLEAPRRLELCRVFNSIGVFDLVADYAASGRKQFPCELAFLIHEAEACFEIKRNIDKGLRKALERAARETAEVDPQMAVYLERLLERSAWHPGRTGRRRKAKRQKTASVFDEIFADMFDD